MRNNELVKSIEREAETSPIKTDDAPSRHGDYRFWVHGETSRNNYITILNSLPAIIKDHLAMTGLLNRLLGVVAQQQIEINQLSFQIEELRRAAISVKVQENINDSIRRLTAQGSDVTDGQVTVKLSGTSAYKSEDAEDIQTGTSHGESGEINVTGEVQTLLKLLAGLSFGYSDKTSRTAQSVEKLVRQRIRSGERSYQGDIHISFGSVTGDPIRKARAEAIKAGKTSPGDDEL
jgi:hypothetical protein